MNIQTVVYLYNGLLLDNKKECINTSPPKDIYCIYDTTEEHKFNDRKRMNGWQGREGCDYEKHQGYV